jgi:hypothetical protein
MSEALSSLDVLDWNTAAVAALVALLCAIVVRRSSSRWAGALLRVAVAVVAVAATFGWFQISAERQQAAALRAWQVRHAELAAHALAPGSPLACLNGDAGEAVETACEKAIFARPETVAAAVTYVAARLSLLADAFALGSDDEEFKASLAGLRRALELDRYGIAAHVLAVRDGCNVEACRAFAWVEDPTALKANLKAQAFDGYVAHHSADWAKSVEPAKPSAQAPQANVPQAEAPQANAAPPPIVPFASRYDFPSAASIPPVSIMNKEPPRPPEPGAAAPQEQPATGAMPMPPKRPQTQGAAAR